MEQSVLLSCGNENYRFYSYFRDDNVCRRHWRGGIFLLEVFARSLAGVSTAASRHRESYSAGPAERASFPKRYRLAFKIASGIFRFNFREKSEGAARFSARPGGEYLNEHY